MAVFPRCNGQVIVRFDQYDGEDLLDLRKWVFSDRGLKAPRLGAKFKLDELEKLAEAVNAAIGQVDSGAKAIPNRHPIEWLGKSTGGAKLQGQSNH